MDSRLCANTAVAFSDMENFSILGEIPANVRRLRKARGLSLAEVTSRMAALGVPLGVNGLSKLELGNRGADIDLLVALAKALGVPPLELLFPLGHVGEIEVFPGTIVDTWAAAKWFTGEAPFPGGGTDNDVDLDASPITYFREQDRLIAEWYRARDRVMTARAEMGQHSDRPDIQLLRQQELHYLEERLPAIEGQLGLYRAIMQKQGVDPGGLPVELSHVEQRGLRDGER